MPKQLDPTTVAKSVAAVIRDHLAQAFTPLLDRIDSIERSIREFPVPKDGRDGVDGKNGEPGLKGENGAPGRDGAPGADGKDGRDGVDGKEGAPGLNGENGSPGRDGAPGADGKDGRNGIDGKSVTTQEVLPHLQEFTREFLSSLPVPKDGTNGKDGKDGVDGKSLTMEDLRPFMDSAISQWALDFERRASDILQRCVDRIERPKDGKDGKDGRDAFDLKNFDAQLLEDGRTLKLSYSGDTATIERCVVLSHVLDRGVYRSGQKYLRGDGVSFGGSFFIAQYDTETRPETDDSWRLAVKRGRNGKDAVVRPAGPPPLVKIGTTQ